MASGSKIVGLWGDPPAPAAEAPATEPVVEDYAPDEARPGRGDRAIVLLCAVLALAWLGFAAWAAATSVTTPADAVGAIATVSAPLALIGVFYLLLMRSSRREARRFGETTAGLRDEAIRLETRVAALGARLEDNRRALAAQAESLTTLGEEASGRLGALSAAMREDADAIGTHAGALDSAAEAARADMAVLLSSLPKAQVQTRQLAAALQAAGSGAIEQAQALETQIAALAARGQEADNIAGGAAERLAAHLGRIESASADAGAKLAGAASGMNETVDAALARAAEAVDAARRGIEAQGDTMLALVEQSRATLARTTDETADSLARRVTAIVAEVDALGVRLEAHDKSGHALISWLSNGLADIEARLTALDSDGTARTERLGTAVATLSGHAGTLAEALASSGDTAETLIGRAETLLTALDASAREIDETLPAALARLQTLTQASGERISALAPDIGALEAIAGTTIDRLAETEKLLIQQREAIDLLDASVAERLAGSRQSAEQLADALAAADGQARNLVDQASPQLIEAMLRVRDTAQQAAERARETLARIIPEASSALGAASEQAIEQAISGRIETQMAAIATAAERAVDAAGQASQRLAAQMVALTDSTADIDSRFEQHRTQTEESSRETFARRVSLLIESLNSTAIDVTKILSNDVTDSAWAAYLKGDRGVFTRRAVRLLDAAEAREVLRHYEDDAEFREQVNRYVHDFESMLRTVLNSRDGSPLGVTILSSDMGKLYVALAQAIERLRN